MDYVLWKQAAKGERRVERVDETRLVQMMHLTKVTTE